MRLRTRHVCQSAHCSSFLKRWSAQWIQQLLAIYKAKVDVCLQLSSPDVMNSSGTGVFLTKCQQVL